MSKLNSQYRAQFRIQAEVIDRTANFINPLEQDYNQAFNCLKSDPLYEVRIQVKLLFGWKTIWSESCNAEQKEDCEEINLRAEHLLDNLKNTTID